MGQQWCTEDTTESLSQKTLPLSCSCKTEIHAEVFSYEIDAERTLRGVRHRDRVSLRYLSRMCKTAAMFFAIEILLLLFFVYIPFLTWSCHASES